MKNSLTQFEGHLSGMEMKDDEGGKGGAGRNGQRGKAEGTERVGEEHCMKKRTGIEGRSSSAPTRLMTYQAL